jgi:hypothetical protein
LFDRTTASEPGFKPAAMEPCNLKDFATQQLGFLRHSNVNESDMNKARDRRILGESVDQKSEVFLLAWACQQRGLDDLALDLGRQAYQIQAYYTSSENPPTNVIEELQQELGSEVIYNATLDCGKPEVSRTELLDRFQRFVRDFPRSQYVSNATEAVTILSRMILEDKAHAELAQDRLPLDKLPVRDRVAELIFQLRDQHGEQLSQPGWCDIFLDPRKEKSPASQLVALGYDAVPQLIEALGDQRFTRSVGFWRMGVFSHHVLRVGECAEAILSRIAGRTFYSPTCTSCYMSNEEKTAATREAALAWWKQFQKKGEEQAWIEVVSSGQRDAMELAPRLLQKYPADAIAPICRGIEKAEDYTTGCELIDVLGGTNDNATTRFLSKQMQTHRLLACRIASANILWRRGVEAALPAMINEWGRLRDSLEGTETEDLVEFLARSDRPEGIDALTSNWKHRSIDTRETIIESIDEALDLSGTNKGQTNAMSDDDRVMVTDTAALVSTEKLLIYALSDTKQRPDDPRICDLAGDTLAKFWKGRYVFDDKAFLPDRERQRITCINLWRASHNEPLLPLPPQRHVEPADAKTIGPLLQRLQSAKTVGDRTAVLTEIETLGLPTLARLVEIQTNAPNADAEWKAPVAASANRLSRRIVETRFTDHSAPPNDTFRTFVDGMKGKTFDPENLVSVLTAFFKEPIANVRGIELTALRNADLTGTELLLELVPYPKNIRYTEGLTSHETIEANGKTSYGSFDAMYLKSPSQPGEYHDLSEDINKALEAPPTASLMIKIRICHETQIWSSDEKPSAPD